MRISDIRRLTHSKYFGRPSVVLACSARLLVEPWLFPLSLVAARCRAVRRLLPLTAAALVQLCSTGSTTLMDAWLLEADFAAGRAEIPASLTLCWTMAKSFESWKLRGIGSRWASMFTAWDGPVRVTSVTRRVACSFSELHAAEDVLIIVDCILSVTKRLSFLVHVVCMVCLYGVHGKCA